ncbi:hypothetical protein Tco_1506229 [Tanacetum coccineum]
MIGIWKNGSKRVAMKIYIQKAYDTVSWDFLEDALKMFEFPAQMIQWIMVYVRTANSLLMSMASVFILPKLIVKDIHRLFKGFLWCQGDLSRGKAKVAWKHVCKLKNQCSLGIRDLAEWDEYMINKDVWKWPVQWLMTMPEIHNIQVPALNENQKDYTMNAFILWLVVIGRLATQDRIMKWLKLVSLKVRQSPHVSKVAEIWQIETNKVTSDEKYMVKWKPMEIE